MIRKAQQNDIDAVLHCYENARAIMRSSGNLSQWPSDYPGLTDAVADLAAGNLYVVEEKGQVVAAFTFVIGEEPTYRVIEDGEWLSEALYGTIHRLASAGTARGVFRECLNFCLSQINHLRIDTHADNKKMLQLIEAAGFHECGTIYVENGTPRKAFEYIATD